MANIAISNYCNLQCPYCFANKFITEEEKELITLDQLDVILDFIDRDSKDSIEKSIGIIGGEPTIHPQFKEIYNKINTFSKKHYFSPPVVYTNGILLGQFAELVHEATILVNINSPDTIGEFNWKNLIKSLDKFKACNLLNLLTFGINLYPNMPDYKYILDLAVKYRRPFVRCSYVAPTCQFEHLDKDSYYRNAKSLFLDFCKLAAERNIKVHLDCNHIPRCYFTDIELDWLDTNVDGWHTFCNPVIDITPDMKASSCFGAYNLVDINKFNNMNELYRYFSLKEMYSRNIKNGTGQCKDCPAFENLSCQGGCLAFTR